MNTTTLDLFALVLLLILVVIFPLIGVWDFRRLMRWAEEGRADARIKTYNWILIMEWGTTTAFLAWWFFTGKGLAPQNPREDKLFVMVAITAGVCEEIIYRGLLMAVLIPLVGTWVAVAVSSIIFGLGHVYQGVAGIGKTAFLGLIMALLTVFSGSVFIAIILHAVIDLTSGRMMGAALRR